MSNQLMFQTLSDLFVVMFLSYQLTWQLHCCNKEWWPKQRKLDLSPVAHCHICDIKRTLQNSSAAFFIKLLCIAHYVIYIHLAHFTNYHNCWRQYYLLNCWKRFPYIINLTVSNSRCALIKNYLKDESTKFLLNHMRLLIINEEFKAQFMPSTEFSYTAHK